MMLLSILLVADESSYHVASTLTQSIESQLALLSDWKGNYELLTITLSDKELIEATGNISVINALLVQKGHLSQCSGKYIWILPCFITVETNPTTFAMLFEALSMGMTAVALYSGSSSVEQSKFELGNSITELLPITQIFDEFRYIMRRDSFEECFAKDADFLISLAYLSFKESQKNRSLYAKISCELPVVSGIASPALFSLSLSFYSGMRIWQREALIFPRCLRYWVLSKEKMDNRWSQEQHTAFSHYLFSCCSALLHYSRSIFNESNSGTPKDEASSLVGQIIANLEQLSKAFKVSHNLSAQIAILSFFLNHWQKIVVEPVASENKTNPEEGKDIFSGIWWLGRDLEDSFNQLSEQHFHHIIHTLQGMINESL